MSVVFQRKTSKFDTILISDVNRYTFLSKKHQLVCFFSYSLFLLLLQLLPIHRNHRFFTYSLFILLLQLLLYIEIKKFVLNRCKSHNLPILSPVLFLLQNKYHKKSLFAYSSNLKRYSKAIIFLVAKYTSLAEPFILYSKESRRSILLLDSDTQYS